MTRLHSKFLTALVVGGLSLMSAGSVKAAGDTPASEFITPSKLLAALKTKHGANFETNLNTYIANLKAGGKNATVCSSSKAKKLLNNGKDYLGCIVGKVNKNFAKKYIGELKKTFDKAGSIHKPHCAVLAKMGDANLDRKFYQMSATGSNKGGEFHILANHCLDKAVLAGLASGKEP